MGCDALTSFGENKTPVSLVVKWVPLEAGKSTGTLSVPLTEASSVAIGGALVGGSFATPLNIAGTIWETFKGAASCGIVAAGKRRRRRSKAVRSLARRWNSGNERVSGSPLAGTLLVAGEAHALGEMDAYALPGGLEHEAQAGSQGALVLDVFQPVREDYRDAAGAG